MEQRQRQSSVDDAVIAADHLRVRKQLGEAAAVDVHVDGGGTSVSRSAPPPGTSAARRGPLRLLAAPSGCCLCTSPPILGHNVEHHHPAHHASVRGKGSPLPHQGLGGDDGTPSGGEVWIIGYTATPQAEVCMAAPRSHLRCCICSNKGPRVPLPLAFGSSQPG
ncbi:hypothetical protein BHE74_00035451 [Ensete ventricosum]|nr:hypothetical protein BHE74_00035451 [Ensete ventricosum]